MTRQLSKYARRRALAENSTLSSELVVLLNQEFLDENEAEAYYPRMNMYI